MDIGRIAAKPAQLGVEVKKPVQIYCISGFSIFNLEIKSVPVIAVIIAVIVIACLVLILPLPSYDHRIQRARIFLIQDHNHPGTLN